MINRQQCYHYLSRSQSAHHTQPNGRNDTPAHTNPNTDISASPYSYNLCIRNLLNMLNTFTQGLQRIAHIGSSAKKHWKETITAFALPVILANNVNAGVLNTRCISSLNRPRLSLVHINGATENYDTAYDAVYLQGPDSRVCIYSKTNYLPPEDRLGKDARPPESMSTINSEVSGAGLSAPENANLQFTFYDIGEDNFFWKNIIGELSQRIDDGKGSYTYAKIGDYDIKNLVNSARTLPISIENGVTQGDVFFPSHKLDYSFFHYCDFNRDTRINGLDFDILNENFGRDNTTDPNTFGSYVGSDVNDFNAYADIDRSGAVDCDDLEIFKTYFRFPGDLNSDGRVGLDDFAYLANDWNIRDANFYDLQAFAGDYLRDINEPSTW